MDLLDLLTLMCMKMAKKEKKRRSDHNLNILKQKCVGTLLCFYIN